MDRRVPAEGRGMQSPSDDLAERTRVFETVRAELLRVRREQDPGFDAEIRPESLLVADLGLDSISLVEAIVALEQAFDIERLSLDEIADPATAGARVHFTVGSLVTLCLASASSRACGVETAAP